MDAVADHFNEKNLPLKNFESLKKNPNTSKKLPAVKSVSNEFFAVARSPIARLKLIRYLFVY
jgi:hypothetical protein